jgi:hypothetical protein
MCYIVRAMKLALLHVVVLVIVLVPPSPQDLVLYTSFVLEIGTSYQLYYVVLKMKKMKEGSALCCLLSGCAAGLQDSSTLPLVTTYVFFIPHISGLYSLEGTLLLLQLP